MPPAAVLHPQGTQPQDEASKLPTAEQRVGKTQLLDRGAELLDQTSLKSALSLDAPLHDIINVLIAWVNSNFINKSIFNHDILRDAMLSKHKP